MKKQFLTILVFFACLLSVVAQGRQNDISPAQLPSEVKTVLGQYLGILQQSANLDECAERFSAIAGGSLVNEDGISLRSRVKPYALKKDFENIKFYRNPIRITRVNVSHSNGMGFGPSAIRGKVYKIWIDKKEGVGGMPAPISIMVPEGHAQITTPKVVNIGSL
ncbi:MAG: hypothetical protein JJT94_16225 [Bernardetiaceae bacterium]|nr:hypothetical protein [Bernardetiaceae bacterium]